jgi:hypothetical protein
MHPANPRCPRAVAAAPALLPACGGAGAPPPADIAAATLKVGDTYTVEVRTGGQVVESHEYLLHGVSPQGELVPTASDGLVPGALIPLPITKEDKSSHGEREPLTQEQLRAFYKRLADAKARRDGLMNAQALAQEIDDLDGDIASLFADQQRSGLNEEEYLAFYDALDQVPHFDTQTDAEAQMRAFFEDVNEYDLQGPTCSTSQGQMGWNYSPPDPACAPARRSADRATMQGAVPPPTIDYGTWNALLHTYSTDMPGFLAVMAERGDTFPALSDIYRRWRWYNPSGVTMRDFLAFYLNGGSLNSLPQLPFGLAAQKRVSPRAITAIGKRPCLHGGSWDVVISNQIVPESDDTGTCIGFLTWDRSASHIPFTDGQTLESPPTTVSFINGKLVLGQVTMQWRATYTVGAVSGDPAQHQDFAPLITAHVTELRHQNPYAFSATAEAWIGADSPGVALKFKVSKLQGQGLLNFRTEERASTLIFNGGFR